RACSAIFTRMIRALVIALVFVAGCDKGKKEKPAAPAPAPVTAGTVSADGVRRIDVNVDKDGYKPDRIAGKPGEKLNLVFKRTFEAECIAKLKTPDGKLVDLPMNTPVEVAVTVPEKGELGFACGMDMFHGTIVAQPGA